jgi:polysaccharide deacetylase family protein (PEP-CTERM system associated)
MERHILTVDVEDNFTFDELSDKNDWLRYEGQVVENTLQILHLLKKYDATATFFVVGIVAERHPEIVRFIMDGKHEVASHSYWHKPLSKLSVEEIEQDVKASSELLKALSGCRILGYRAMGYSMPNDQSQFYQLLIRYGFLYDSSKKINIESPGQAIRRHNLYSIYPSVINVLGKRIVFSGGTYLRFLPNIFIKKGFTRYRDGRQPVMLYVHPWEFNKDQPRRNVPLLQRILQSPKTFTTKKKLEYLLARYRFVPIRDYLGL